MIHSSSHSLLVTEWKLETIPYTHSVLFHDVSLYSWYQVQLIFLVSFLTIHKYLYFNKKF